MADNFIRDYETMTIILRSAGYQLSYLDDYKAEFFQYCNEYFPDDSVLSRELAEGWIHNTASKSKTAFNRRIQTMKKLGTYQRGLGKDAYIPDYYVKPDPSPEPVLFTSSELAEFFRQADRIPHDYRSPNRETIFPVLFRLLYCCGMRASEACRLKVEDVDFETGSLTIYHSKGHKDRVVYMNDDVCDLCARFHKYYSRVMPERIYFFQPSNKKLCYTAMDVDNHFRRVMKKTSFYDPAKKQPTPHGLRHLFAVNNLKKCLDEGGDFNNWIQYLGQYMGHSKLRDTMYYMHMISELLPSYSKIISGMMEGIGVKHAQ